MVGDLKYGRTVHSLVQAMCNFNAKFNFVSPVELKMPSTVIQYIKNAGLEYHEYTELEDVIPHSDIIYMTRVQRERFPDPLEYEKVKNSYILRNEMLENSKPNCRILHPLPRVNEINTDVDPNPKAYYFQQAQNGLYVRQALIAAILGINLIIVPLVSSVLMPLYLFAIPFSFVPLLGQAVGGTAALMTDLLLWLVGGVVNPRIDEKV